MAVTAAQGDQIMSEEKRNEAPKMRTTISKKALFSILLIAFVLGFTAIVIGYNVYSNTMDNHYRENTMNIANTISALVDRETVEKYGKLILSKYRETTQEERDHQEEESYRSHFEGIEESEDYQEIRTLLTKIKEQNGVTYAYIMVIDKANQVCIYIADGDVSEDTYCAPGVWETIEDDQADSLLGGNKAIIPQADFGWLASGGSPIYVAEDGTFASSIIDISMDDVMLDRRMFLLDYCIILLLVVAVLSIIMTWAMRRQVVFPLNKLAKAAINYSNDRSHHEKDHAKMVQHFANLNIHTGDEIENLSYVMSDMETQLAGYIENLTRVTAEKERIGAELNIATQIQANMLPRIFPAFPDRKDFDIYATMHPAKEVGGDFYDYFLIDDDHLGLVMADVSGKGVPAALFMVIAKTLIKNRAQMGGTPAEILGYVNNQLCDGNEADLFVTVWLAIVELSTGKGVSCNAGHEHPVLCRNNGKYELIVYRHSPAVATFEGLRFREREFQLYPGDKLFVYTDGVPEATNSQGEFFGSERMLMALNENPDASPQKLLQTVRGDLNAFVGSAPQFDDITMLCMVYKGPVETPLSLTVEASVDNLPKVLEFLDAHLESLDCPIKAQMQLDVAIEELFVNIAHYAYKPGTGNATIQLEKKTSPETDIVITLIDSGMAFNPLEKADPDVSLSAEERQIGGLGIYMAKKTMDSMTYERRDNKNILQVSKKLF